jgi:hypothetical protein
VGPIACQKFEIIAENMDKNADKMACKSKGSKNDEVEVVEMVGCGGLDFSSISDPLADCAEVSRTRIAGPILTAFQTPLRIALK